MHEHATLKIQRHVLGCLINCDVVEGWPVFESFSPHVASLSKELLKHKSEWLSESDVYTIFYDFVYGILRSFKKSEDSRKESLRDLLGEEGTQNLARDLSDFYVSIPRRYEIYIPIPKAPSDLKTVAISDLFALHVFDSAEEIPGGPTNVLHSMFGGTLQPKRAYFRTLISGYCSNNVENITVRRALSNFKIAFQQAISKGLFKITTSTPAGLGLLGGLSHYSVQKSKLACVDITSNSKQVVDVELPLDLSKLLESIVLNTDSKQWQTAVEKGEATDLLKGYFRLPSLLMASSDPDSDRVRAAIEWCFDSYATENATLSFLQTCIGLEALFGDEANHDNLTKTLADRCAYLTGTDIKGRKTIRENFRALYETRSKIVHGSASSLGANERHHLDWGRIALQISILKEIKHLALDKS